jgi:hypothetical protein
MVTNAIAASLYAPLQTRRTVFSESSANTLAKRHKLCTAYETKAPAGLTLSQGWRAVLTGTLQRGQGLWRVS